MTADTTRRPRSPLLAPSSPLVLITYAAHKEVGIEADILRAAGAAVVATEATDTPEALAAYPDVDALMVSIQPISAELMDRMPRCKIICRGACGP